MSLRRRRCLKSGLATSWLAVAGTAHRLVTGQAVADAGIATSLAVGTTGSAALYGGWWRCYRCNRDEARGDLTSCWVKAGTCCDIQVIGRHGRSELKDVKLASAVAVERDNLHVVEQDAGNLECFGGAVLGEGDRLRRASSLAGGGEGRSGLANRVLRLSISSASGVPSAGVPRAARRPALMPAGLRSSAPILAALERRSQRSSEKMPRVKSTARMSSIKSRSITPVSTSVVM